MAKTIFISNRLPVTVSTEEEGFSISESIGGLATGLKAFHRESEDNIWLGWPGVTSESLDGREEELRQTLQASRYEPVFLSEDHIEGYYQGFSNGTLWPLFHYFPNLTSYHEDHWDAYCQVNRGFAKALEPLLESGDTIWIHDYQLMLLPQLIRDMQSDVAIGFFLHIPFPSYELFRLLPWRDELLQGILGADLIGFHTYDYVRHFLSSTRRILGFEHDMNFIKYDGRLIRADVFPMGIDYDYFADAKVPEDVRIEMSKLLHGEKEYQVILSVDRLDFTKGIPGRIRSFANFLEMFPEYREKVSLILIVAPSRTQVDTYADLLKEIQELVSETNGKFSSLSWVPIWYFFRSFTQEQLIALYQQTDVMMVTPLRDGMNLVAKEYVAARSDRKGMLVISETAGAASELGEAVVVNPNNFIECAEGLKTALEMDEQEQIERNEIMHQRIERYNIHHWAGDFLEKLYRQREYQEEHKRFLLDAKHQHKIQERYNGSKSRLILLDYDGTLMDFKPKPNQARPDAPLLELIQALRNDPANRVVIISGRDRHTLDSWLGNLNIDLVASHGLWIRQRDEAEWHQTEVLDNSWKQEIRPILEMTTDRTPGSLIEEKDFSLAWHYRRCEPELAQIRLRELKDALLAITSTGHVGLLDGNRVLEVKDATVNKGRAAGTFLADAAYDFILAAGDDVTDEDLFAVIDEHQFSIKIGEGDSSASYYTRTGADFRNLLRRLAGLNA